MLCIGYSLGLALCLTSNDRDDMSTVEYVFFGLYLLCNSISPLVFFRAFLKDSRFWSGISEMRRTLDHSRHTGARTPLLYPLDRGTMKTLADFSDSLSSCMLNPVHLEIDSDTILGQGSGAKVFAGMMGIQNSKYGYLLCAVTTLGLYRRAPVAVKMLYHPEVRYACG